MRRILFALVCALFCTGCGNVVASAPTAVPQPITVEARLIGRADMVLDIANNTSTPLNLGGWSMQITPVVSPTLVAAMPFPAEFTVPAGKKFRAHTSGGTNSADTLFFDNLGKVPPEAWNKGVKIEMRDPKGSQVITRFVYRYALQPK